MLNVDVAIVVDIVDVDFTFSHYIPILIYSVCLRHLENWFICLSHFWNRFICYWLQVTNVGHAHGEKGGFKKAELFMLVLGAVLPLLLTVGHHH